MSDRVADAPFEEQIVAYVEKYKDSKALTIGELHETEVERTPDQVFIHDVAVAVARIQLGPRYLTAADLAQANPYAGSPLPKAADILAGRVDRSESKCYFENLSQGRLYLSISNGEFESIKEAGNDVLATEEQKQALARALEAVAELIKKRPKLGK